MLPRRYCCRERSYIWSGPGPAGLPDGPTGAPAPDGSAGSGWRASCSSRARCSLSRCCVCPVSSCTATSCCCTARRSVRMSPRSWIRYACCAPSACWTARTTARSESRSAARAASLLARSAWRAWTWSSTFRTSPRRAQPATSPSAKTTGLRPDERVPAPDDLKLVAAVLRPGGLVVSVHERPFLAPRLGLDAARVDAVTHEVLLARLGAPVAEREVVFVRAALVAVPVDPDAEVGVGLQDGDLLVERPGVVRANVRLVVVEMDHRRQHGAHGLGGAPECGQRIGLARPRLAVRFLTRPAGLLLPRQTLGPGLRCRGRVGVGLRGQLLDGLFPAARAGEH